MTKMVFGHPQMTRKELTINLVVYRIPGCLSLDAFLYEGPNSFS